MENKYINAIFSFFMLSFVANIFYFISMPYMISAFGTREEGRLIRCMIMALKYLLRYILLDSLKMAKRVFLLPVLFLGNFLDLCLILLTLGYSSDKSPNFPVSCVQSKRHSTDFTSF